MLTVVQDHQQHLVANEAGQPLGRGRGPHPRLAGHLAEAQGRDHHLDHQTRVADGGQLDQPHPIRIAARHPPGQLQRHTRLARPTRPGHRHQPMQLHQLGQLPQLLVAADQAGQPLGQVVGRCGRCLAGSFEGGVLDQDPLVQPLQLRRGVDAQLLSQHLPPLLVDPKRVGLATRPVQRHHQQPTKALPGRLGRHQPLQLPHQAAMPTRGQPHLDQRLHRPQAQLLQPRRRSLRPRPIRELGQRRPPPQPQRRLQQPGRLGPSDLPGLGHQPLEPGRVHPPRLHHQPIPRRAGHHHR
jgi:hypothetical protein